jgi:galactokinase
VRRGIELWKAGDLPAFGGLMNASCESSIRDYETGSPELVRLQAILLETPGVLGARFSGGGFGGCAVALVEPDAVDGACASISSRFAAAHPALARRVRAFSVASEDGARVV